MADQIRDIRDKIRTTQEYIAKQKQLIENAECLVAAYQLQLEGLEGANEATKAIQQICANMPSDLIWGQEATVSKPESTDGHGWTA